MQGVYEIGHPKKTSESNLNIIDLNQKNILHIHDGIYPYGYKHGKVNTESS